RGLVGPVDRSKQSGDGQIGPSEVEPAIFQVVLGHQAKPDGLSTPIGLKRFSRAVSFPEKIAERLVIHSQMEPIVLRVVRSHHLLPKTLSVPVTFLRLLEPAHTPESLSN